MTYPWYQIAGEEDNLQQGDIVLSCPVVIPKGTKFEIGKDYESETLINNVIIMSQSCDLIPQSRKLDLVLVCPIYNLEYLSSSDPRFTPLNEKNNLRRGRYASLHLLNRCDLHDGLKDFLVVDFRNVYSVGFDFLINFAKRDKKRVRLMPPYREHLSQSFARFFMRVGLPVDIPEFK